MADYLASRSLFGRVVQYLLCNVTGVLSLREGLSLNKNNAVMVGLVESKAVQNIDQLPVEIGATDQIFPEGFVLYGGSIGWATGLELFFQLVNECTDVQFVVTGKPFEMTEEQLRLLFEQNCKGANVVFLGAVERGVYRTILERSGCILSMRDPTKKEHEGNFPSKIIEALSFKKPLISTITYSEIPSNVYIPCEYDTLSIEVKIKRIFDGEVLISKEAQRKFLRAECSGQALVEKIDLLMEGGSP